MDSDLRSALLHQQMVSQISLVDETQSSRLPLEVDAYHHLMPLESIGLKSLTLNPILTSTFRVNHRNGLNYCMKRIHGKIFYTKYFLFPMSFQLVEMYQKVVFQRLKNGNPCLIPISFHYTKFSQQKHSKTSHSFSSMISIPRPIRYQICTKLLIFILELFRQYLLISFWF